MELIKNSESSYTCVLDKLIDMETAPAFEKEIMKIPCEAKILTLDFNEVNYMSSAGLRVILFAKKKMGLDSEIIIKNISDKVKSIFEMTGTTKYITFE